MQSLRWTASKKYIDDLIFIKSGPKHIYYKQPTHLMAAIKSYVMLILCTCLVFTMKVDTIISHIHQNHVFCR